MGRAVLARKPETWNNLQLRTLSSTACQKPPRRVKRQCRLLDRTQLTTWTLCLAAQYAWSPALPSPNRQGHKQVGEDRLREATSSCDILLAPDLSAQLLSTATSIGFS